jgi:predicted component of type VI protein secretion system
VLKNYSPTFVAGGRTVTTEEQERMNTLCQLIQKETDHKKLSEMVAELNLLLDEKKDQLRDDKPTALK